jgi:WhiB family redox-sensing transcriptional regulator
VGAPGGDVAVHTNASPWQARAACRGPESALFFPPAISESRADREARERRAKAICGTCPVLEECLAYALRIREPHGVWGGRNEVERQKLLELRAG